MDALTMFKQGLEEGQSYTLTYIKSEIKRIVETYEAPYAIDEITHLIGRLDK